MHVICSVVGIGVVRSVWLRGRKSACKQKVLGLILGGGMPVRFNYSSAAPARTEELVVTALAKERRHFHQY